MSETDSPVEGSGNDTALSVEAGAAAIENLLSSVPDAPEKAPDSAPNEESNAGQKEASAEPPDDELDGLELDDETTTPVADAPSDKPDTTMKFAPDDAKVVVDGKTISVAELKAGNMFQRTFTEKTMALAEEKKAFEQDRQSLAETKKQIEQQAEVVLTLASRYLPKEPIRPEDPDDAWAWIQYQRAKDAYLEETGQLDYLWQLKKQGETQLTEAQMREQEQLRIQQQEQHQQFLAEQHEKFLNANPRLKDKDEFIKFGQETIQLGQAFYDLPAEEIAAIPDARYLRVLADAIAFRKAVAKRDAAKNPTPVQPAQQPRIQQRQRMAPQTPQARDHNSALDRLRKTGSLDDAAAALKKFVW